jgi:hypothetical protein
MKAIMITTHRRAIVGGIQTTRALWCLGEDVVALQGEFKRAKAFARKSGSDAWSVEIVDEIRDKPPSQW